MQQLIDIVVRESENKGLYLNGSKSFTIVFLKSTVIPTCSTTIHGTSLEQIKSFIYLGSMFTSDGRCVQDVRQRIGIAKCCCLPTPMTVASGGSSMFPLVVHQPAPPSIWTTVQSLRRGLSTNPGVTMWFVCGCS